MSSAVPHGAAPPQGITKSSNARNGKIERKLRRAERKDGSPAVPRNGAPQRNAGAHDLRARAHAMMPLNMHSTRQKAKWHLLTPLLTIPSVALSTSEGHGRRGTRQLCLPCRAVQVLPGLMRLRTKTAFFCTRRRGHSWHRSWCKSEYGLQTQPCAKSRFQGNDRSAAPSGPNLAEVGPEFADVGPMCALHGSLLVDN